MQLTENSMRYVKLKLARYVKLSVYKHDRAQSGTTYSGTIRPVTRGVNPR